MSDRFIIAILADEHAGSKLALCNPKTKFQIKKLVGDHYEKIPWQPVMEPLMEAVWEKYVEGVEKVKKLAGKDPVYLFKLGEVCEGTYYANSSMELRKHYQVKMAIANMDPWKKVSNLKSIRIVPGDRPHEFDEGSAANMVGDALRQEFGDVDVNGHGLWLHKKTGFKMDYSHRGPYPGSRKWLEGNVARLYLKDYMMREIIEFGRKPADLLVRAHYHEPVEVDEHIVNQNGKHDSKLLISPCLKFPDAYAKSVTGNRFSATIGTSAVEVFDGIMRVHDNFLKVDTRNWEVCNG